MQCSTRTSTNMVRKEVVLVCSILLLIYVKYSTTKVFTRCDLAKELLRQGFPKSELKQWICLAEAESERNTRCKNGPKKDSSYNYGIFQINGLFYCGLEKPGGECRVLCSELLSGNITKACKCAMMIKKQFSFMIWDKFRDKCRDTLPKLALCGIHY